MSESNITLHSSTRTSSLDLPLDASRDAESFGKFAAPSFASGSAILRRIFAFPVMLSSLLVGGVFILARLFQVDPDLWWHIKVGDAILQTHHWPTTDIYSFTVSGQPWIAYEWLGEVVLAAAYRIAGIVGLECLLILLGSAVMLSLYALTIVRTGNSKAGFVASGILFVLAGLSFSLRPQMLGYLFLILTLIVLERFRQGYANAVWFLPAIMLLWVNTHGSWIIGMGIIFVYWMCGLVEFRAENLEARRWTHNQRCRISFAFLLCLLALPITPYGTRIAVSPFEFAFSLPLNVKYIEEWQSMPFSFAGGKLFLALVLGMFLAQVTLRLRWQLEDVALYLFGTTMACLHVRFLLIFVPLFAPFLATILARCIPAYHPDKDKWILNAALIACIAAAVFHYFPSRAKLDERVAEHFPVSAVEYLKKNPAPGPMFNNYGFGGYLVWALGPQQKVFIDGRGDVYERGGVLADYVHITHLRPASLAVLRGYGVKSCLVQRDEPLATLLSASPEWQRIYSDAQSALFTRRSD